MRILIFALSVLVSLQANAIEGLSNGKVTFVYQGTSSNQDVRVLGEFKTESYYSIDWEKNGIKMVPDDHNVYRVEIHVEANARFEYLFTVDGNRILDPSNPLKVFNGPMNAEVSEFLMPKYKVSASKPKAPTLKGKIVELQEYWQIAPIFIYFPANYLPSKRYPVVYTADGSAWKDLMLLPQHIDQLIEEGAIEPVIAVMVNPTPDRRNWYLFNPTFLEYLEKIVTYVDSKFSTLPKPEARLHLGTSGGGRASFYVGMERPRLFRNIALLSPGLNGSLSYYTSFFFGKRRPDRRLKVWISAGSFEGTVFEDAKTMENYLRKQKINVRSSYTNEGHSFHAWEYKIESILKFFFPSKNKKY
jgi:enterochelin esterase-like enzyme